MKKLVLVALLTILLALSIGQMAFAQTCCEEKICQMATENEKVIDAACVIYERCCVVALKTEKFTSKNEYDSFVKELTEKIKAEYEVDRVIVTRNPKIMMQIKALADKSETERDEAIKELIDKIVRHPRPDHGIGLPKRTNG